MTHDKWGEPVSNASASAIEQYNEAVGSMLRYVGDPTEPLSIALTESPDFALARCFTAEICAVMTQPELMDDAAKEVAAAESVATANERERGHIAAAKALVAGDYDDAADKFERILIDHPHDMQALQMAHLMDFYRGDAVNLRDRIARRRPYWSASDPDYGFVLGMQAFGLEECNQYAEAEEAGRAALEQAAEDCWATHAVTHVLEMQGRHAEGIPFLAGSEANWAQDGNAFAYHNWWHLSLFHLEQESFDEVRRLYDEKIHPGQTDIALELIDASAILWRLHLMDQPVGDRWNEIADAWEARVQDGYYAFNDAHAMMAFVGADRPAAAKALLRRMTEATDGSSTNAMMTRDIGLPVARAIQAFGNGDYATATDLLLPVRAYANRFGGSHAQRDVLTRTLIEAALRAGQYSAARAVCNERTAAKPKSPFLWKQMIRATRGLGDTAATETAEAKLAAAA